MNISPYLYTNEKIVCQDFLSKYSGFITFEKIIAKIIKQNPINKYNTMLKTNKRDFTINTLKEIYKLINETNDIEKEKQIITAFENVSIELKKELKIKKEGIYKFISYEVLRDELETKEEKKSKNKL